jgi:hypothetical protein
MHEDIIEFVGLSELDEEEKEVLNNLSTEYYPKIKRLLKNVTSLVVHVKAYKKKGTKQKYSLHVRAIAPTRAFESTKAHGWDLAMVLHKSFLDIEKQIKHKLHSDDQKPKGYA